MDLLCIATSAYGDPAADEWCPDLRYTVSFLRRHQVDVGLAYLRLDEDPLPAIDRMGAGDTGLVYLEITEENRRPVLASLGSIRRAVPMARLALGGMAASLSPGPLLAEHPAVDWVVVGEPEQTLLDLVRQNPVTVRSRGRGELEGPLLPDLDACGHMATDGLAASVARHCPPGRTAYLRSSRGCHGRCTFCGVPDVYRKSGGGSWRGRSPTAVVDEMAALAETYDLRRFIFQDDVFIGPGRRGRERALQIAAEILRRRLDLQFFFCCRLDQVREDVLAPLQEAGLTGIGLSVETTNQDSLDLLGKGIRTEQIYPTLDLVERLSLPCEVNLIFFDPYRTLAGVRRDLALLDTIRTSAYLSYSDAFPFNELMPFAWSRLARRLAAEGLLDQKTGRCRYRDPSVGTLVEFTRRLRQHLPVMFKSSLPFRGLAPYRERALESEQVQAVTRLLPAMRHWVGLSLLPRYLTEACDALERHESAETELSDLQLRFADETRTLDSMEECLVRQVAQ